MILPTTWPFPDAATDQRAAVVEYPRKGDKRAAGTVHTPRRRPPILDDVQDAPY